jgi:hypothetical protein
MILAYYCLLASGYRIHTIKDNRGKTAALDYLPIVLIPAERGAKI